MLHGAVDGNSATGGFQAGTASSWSSTVAVLGHAWDRRTGVDDHDHREPTKSGHAVVGPIAAIPVAALGWCGGVQRARRRRLMRFFRLAQVCRICYS